MQIKQGSGGVEHTAHIARLDGECLDMIEPFWVHPVVNVATEVGGSEGIQCEASPFESCSHSGVAWCSALSPPGSFASPSTSPWPPPWPQLYPRPQRRAISPTCSPSHHPPRCTPPMTPSSPSSPPVFARTSPTQGSARRPSSS